MNANRASSRPDATCRIVAAPVFTLVVEGTVDGTNGRSVAADLVDALGPHRDASVVDLTAVVLADCAGVRLLREAIASLVQAGRPVVVRTGDPVARQSFDVARVA